MCWGFPDGVDANPRSSRTSTLPPRCRIQIGAFVRGWAVVGVLSGPRALAIGPTSLKRGEGHHAV
jgi:hypothetical protein